MMHEHLDTYLYKLSKDIGSIFSLLKFFKQNILLSPLNKYSTKRQIIRQKKRNYSSR